jgi:hypothetical protein
MAPMQSKLDSRGGPPKLRGAVAAESNVHLPKPSRPSTQTQPATYPIPAGAGRHSDLADNHRRGRPRPVLLRAQVDTSSGG